MTGWHGEIELDTALERVDFDTVHGWLSTSYWSPGVSREIVERAAANCSMVVGAYDGERQVGYLRVVSDKTTFAWIADVWVAESHRGRGIAKALVRFALDHPEHQGMRRWVLATRDAHGVYAECGFKPLPEPSRWMIIRNVPGTI
jgi:GNAT superfamily N-acetyltransferase